MDIGIQEIVIILVIVVVLFVGGKLIADKRYLKRPGGKKDKANTNTPT